MRPRWRDLAERAWKPAWAQGEVEEALGIALKSEFREIPLTEIAEIVRGSGQSSLFPRNDARVEQLDALRRDHPGSNAIGILLDCAGAVVVDGLHGDVAVRLAIRNALEARARSGFRQLEEHCQRQGRDDGGFTDRLRAAHRQFPYESLASELMSGSRGGVTLPKHTGVDDGPPL